MGRPANVIPSEKLTLMLPGDVYCKLTAHLWSELEQRVPLGSYQRFFSERIREYFQDEALDLSPYLGTPAGAFIVRGTPQAIAALKEMLI